MKKYLLVINPQAGKRNNQSRIEHIKRRFSDSQIPFTIHLTTQDKRADRIVADEFDDRYSHLVIGGGDGTLNEAINGLPNFSRPIGIIPMGTGNDFVKNLSLTDTLDYLFDGAILESSVGVCNGKKFINGIGAGFDGQIVLNMQKGTGILRGHLAYLYNVVKILGTFKSKLVTYKVDGNEIKERIFLLLAANGTTFGGGFKLAPTASIIDDQLEICIINEVSVLKRFLNLGRLETGSHGKLKEVNIFKARKVEVISKNLHSQIDGEYFGQPPFEISIYPKKLKILVDKS